MEYRVEVSATGGFVSTIGAESDKEASDIVGKNQKTLWYWLEPYIATAKKTGRCRR
ncbi:hypothetical protein AGMMS50268_09230 [Spirochaetia bacterium]|nr:hypothetical protein AGMMS50268_09230 [Spirochaetia bacterium]